jgi:hypothetical protein
VRALVAVAWHGGGVVGPSGPSGVGRTDASRGVSAVGVAVHSGRIMHNRRHSIDHRGAVSGIAELMAQRHVIYDGITATAAVGSTRTMVIAISGVGVAVGELVKMTSSGSPPVSGGAPPWCLLEQRCYGGIVSRLEKNHGYLGEGIHSCSGHEG